MTSSEKLIAKAQDWHSRQGGAFDRALAEIRKMNPTLARQADAEMTPEGKVTLANAVAQDERDSAARATRTEATKKFTKLVRAEQDKRADHDYTKAYATCKFMFKNEFEATQAPVEIANTTDNALGGRTARMEAITDGVRRLMQTSKLSYDDARAEFANQRPEYRPYMFHNTGSGASDGRDGSMAGTGYRYGPGYRPESEGAGPAYRPGPGVGPDYSGLKSNSNDVSYDEIEKYSLPLDSTQAEMDAAKSAGTTDLVKLFRAMVQYTMRSRNFNEPAAQAFCIGRYAKLSHAAKDDLTPAIMSSSQGTSRAG